MKETRLTTWIQTAATVGVLVGIVLVIVELRQAKILANAEVNSQFYTELFNNHRLSIGDNPEPVLLKACLHPENVSDADRVVLRGYFRSWTALVTRARVMEEIAGFGADWRALARLIIRQQIVPFEYGRNMLGEGWTVDPALEEIAFSVLNETDKPTCRDWLAGR